MKISLVITNTKRKSVGFVTDTLKTFSLKEAIAAVKNTAIENTYLVTGTKGTYIRSNPDANADNNIDAMSVTGPQLIAIAQGVIRPTQAARTYIAHYLASIGDTEPVIEPVRSFRVPKSVIHDVFENHRNTVRQAAQEFTIDQYMLGAILIDEIARLIPFEPILEKVGADIVGKDVSIGVAQVKIDTAHDLIRKGLYNPQPDDKQLPFSGNLTNDNRRHLYQYVIQPEHNIRFAASFIRYVINFWSAHIDLSNRPDIIGTLYHQGYGEPKSNPKSNERGEQIAREFYEYAKIWLD